MPPFTFQKAVFYTLKGHLLQANSWPFAKPLIINGLHYSHNPPRRQPHLAVQKYENTT
jgi:hypothetical protein